jgi:hypothetical protein
MQGKQIPSGAVQAVGRGQGAVQINKQWPLPGRCAIHFLFGLARHVQARISGYAVLLERKNLALAA